MAGKSALVIGATGATGKHVLKELLASKDFTHIGEYYATGRRPTQDVTDGKEKLEQRAVDFEKLEGAGLKERKWDVVFITLGTTRAQAGSAAAFEKVDREYVINFARAAKSEDPTHDQRVVYVSSAGASASAPFLYSKSKGLTENGLAELGYKDTIIFRPGFLANAQRKDRRIVESVFGCLMGATSYITSSAQIDVSVLGNAVVKAGRLGSSNLPASVAATNVSVGSGRFTLIGNKGALELGKSNV